jgi:hypothetical protein
MGFFPSSGELPKEWELAIHTLLYTSSGRFSINKLQNIDYAHITFDTNQKPNTQTK